MRRSIIPALFASAVCLAAPVRSIHIFVALCDNENQGIVPVPKRLGNGEDLINNLYWGAGYGVKSYFKKYGGWKLVYDSLNISDTVLERCVFKKGNTFICADAYKGIEIEAAITELLKSVSGEMADSLAVPGGKIGIHGNADLLAYVGHDGLMDFQITREFQKKRQGQKKDVVVLCCMSKQYFTDFLRDLGGNPVLLTTGLMAPEAYTLESAINDWEQNLSGSQIAENAAAVYHKYQKCGLKGARRLFGAR
jgi:hypothetical protein